MATKKIVGRFRSGKILEASDGWGMALLGSWWLYVMVNMCKNLPGDVLLLLDWVVGIMQYKWLGAQDCNVFFSFFLVPFFVAFGKDNWFTPDAFEVRSSSIHNPKSGLKVGSRSFLVLYTSKRSMRCQWFRDRCLYLDTDTDSQNIVSSTIQMIHYPPHTSMYTLGCDVPTILSCPAVPPSRAILI